MEDDKRRSPFTATADGLRTFGLAVVAEIWTGGVTKGSAALASNVMSSHDMSFRRLGLSTYIDFGYAWHLFGTTFIFQGQWGKQENGAKETA